MSNSIFIILTIIGVILLGLWAIYAVPRYELCWNQGRMPVTFGFEIGCADKVKP